MTRLVSTVLSSTDANELAQFYRRLLDWRVQYEEPGWVKLASDAEGPVLSFQTESDYLPPVWPANGDEQRMMMHLDIAVDDLDAAVARALELGASLAAQQPADDVRVCVDPDGHPFCLFES